MTGVVATDDGFRVAAAGLPRSIRLRADPRGAIVAGRVEPDAAALVLRVPLTPGAALPAVPVILVRPFLRTDVVDQAVAAQEDSVHRLVVAECLATSPGDPVLTDTIGWLRILAGGPLALIAVDRTPAAAVAAFAAPGGVTATLTVTLGAPRPGLRVRALGETTVEVTVDAAGAARVTTSRPTGATTAPRRWEDLDRLALRRAVAALDGDAVTDVPGLEHDAAHGASVIHAVDPTHRGRGVAGVRGRPETEEAGSREDRR